MAEILEIWKFDVHERVFLIMISRYGVDGSDSEIHGIWLKTHHYQKNKRNFRNRKSRKKIKNFAFMHNQLENVLFFARLFQIHKPLHKILNQ